MKNRILVLGLTSLHRTETLGLKGVILLFHFSKCTKKIRK